MLTRLPGQDELGFQIIGRSCRSASRTTRLLTAYLLVAESDLQQGPSTGS